MMSEAGGTLPGAGKVGRNDPCPCGSGRKLKHCCERKPVDSRFPPPSAPPSPSTPGTKTRAHALTTRGRDLWRLGKRPEAIDALREAAQLDAENAEAHFNLGVACFGAGQLGEAAASFQRTLALRPGFTKALRPLAYALEHLGNERAASEAYRKLSRVEEDVTERRLCGAKALILEESREEAEKEVRRVIAVAPGNAGARALLGELLAENGRFDEAEPHLVQAMEVYPDVFQRWASAKKVTEADRPLVERARGYLERAELNPVERGSIHFGLGKALDDLGDYGEAMRHYEAGNQLKAVTARINRAGWSARYDAIIADFSAGALTEKDRAPRRPGNPGEELPVFIVGMPRSGTTLVEQILSSHSAVAAAGELSFWTERAMDRMVGGGASNAGDAPPNLELFQPVSATAPALDQRGAANISAKPWSPFGLPSLDRGALAAAGEDYLALLRKIGPKALRVTDKAPFNFERLGLLRLALPYARIIHCRRRPIDTCLSLFFTSFKGKFAWDKADLVFQYREYERLMVHWRQVMPGDRFTEVQYETVVNDRETETRRLIDFCGLEWEDACLFPERNERSVRTASVWQARQPVYKSSLERWRRYEPWLGELGELIPAAERHD